MSTANFLDHTKPIIQIPPEKDNKNKQSLQQFKIKMGRLIKSRKKNTEQVKTSTEIVTKTSKKNHRKIVEEKEANKGKIPRKRKPKAKATPKAPQTKKQKLNILHAQKESQPIENFFQKTKEISWVERQIQYEQELHELITSNTLDKLGYNKLPERFVQEYAAKNSIE